MVLVVAAPAAVAASGPPPVWLDGDPPAMVEASAPWVGLVRLALVALVVIGAIGWRRVWRRPRSLADRAFVRLARVEGLSRADRERLRGEARARRVAAVVVLLSGVKADGRKGVGEGARSTMAR